MMPTKGVRIGAAYKPMAEYRRKKGEVFGRHWHIPNVRPARELRHIRVVRNGAWLRPRCLTPFGLTPFRKLCGSLLSRPPGHRRRRRVAPAIG